MGVDRLIEKAMKRAHGAQASLGWAESTDVSFENDKLKSVKTSQRTGMHVKVIVDGKIGSSHTTDTDDVDGVVERALEAAAFGSPAYFEFPRPSDAPQVAIFDEAVPAVTKEEMVALGEEMLAVVKEYNRDILVGAGAGKSVSRAEFCNSNGTRFTSETTSFGVGVHGQLVRGTDILSAGRSFGWKKREIDHLGVAERTVSLFRMAEKTVPMRSGRYPVIFAPEGMDVLLLALKLGLNGKNVFLGSSPLSDKLGKKIADERFSLTDNPLIDYGGGSGCWDGEGVPHQVTPLVEEGVVKNFLYDLDAAGRAGTKSTGNGVGCGPTNLVVGAGDVPFKEMVKGIREGLIVHRVLGLGQGNPASGLFSVNVHLGYKIEDGEIAGRVKDVMLAGNTYDCLKEVVAVGDKQEWVGGSLLTPPIEVDGLNVVAK